MPGTARCVERREVDERGSKVLRPLPLCVTPEGERDLSAFGADRRDELRGLLVEHGALLFRDFEVGGVAGFRAFCSSLADELLDYREPSTPRSLVEDKVFTSTEYPARAAIPLHGEMSYTTTWPRLLFFFCEVAADQGGETPLADSRAVFARIPPATRERFARHGGVRYVRNFRDGMDIPWRTVFAVETEAELEACCRARGIEFSWKPNGVLRTSTVAQATARHPVTGEMVWFNQAHLFHVSALEEKIRKTLVAKFGEDGLPRHAFYGDGTAIEQTTLDEVRSAYAQAELVFPWQRGDVLMVDNMLVSHGRRPFRGERRVLVAMGDAYPAPSIARVEAGGAGV
jgi:alpha-ketoglutarate-dependent taurine dioxygenase